MERSLHPLVIAGALAALLGGGAWGWSAWEDHKRAARQEALQPLEAEWARLRERAVPVLAKIEAVLSEATTPQSETCEGLNEPVDVVHRPILQALAAGERFPRPDAPWWLSSDPYAYLAESVTPSMDVESYRERNDVVARALHRPCVAVLDTAVAEPTRLQGERRFEGGAVLGWLSVVCPEQGKVLCRVPLASQPSLAISLKQKDARSQSAADAMAVGDAARHDYERAVERALGTATD